MFFFRIQGCFDHLEKYLFPSLSVLDVNIFWWNDYFSKPRNTVDYLFIYLYWNVIGYKHITLARDAYQDFLGKKLYFFGQKCFDPKTSVSSISYKQPVNSHMSG